MGRASREEGWKGGSFNCAFEAFTPTSSIELVGMKASNAHLLYSFTL